LNYRRQGARFPKQFSILADSIVIAGAKNSALATQTAPHSVTFACHLLGRWARRENNMVQEISVTPAQGGWTVAHSGAIEPMVFLSGAKAEDAARKIGAAMADAGHAAEIRITLRDGTLAGRFVCVPTTFEVR
jgi:hypothetical protein